MPVEKKIRLLIVDDSIFFRTAMTNILANHPQIEVVGTAADAFEAQRKMKELRPDVLTLDINMPKMNGIEFLKATLPKQWIPVVVISTQNDIVFEAMNAGAVDFVEKPSMTPGRGAEEFAQDIAQKIIAASKAIPKIKSVAQQRTAAKQQPRPLSMGTIPVHSGLIALGASTGGTEATSFILRQLPPNIPGMVIVQHMPPVFTEMYAQRLNRETKLTVKEAAEGDIVQPGHAYIAPGDRHIVVEKKGSDRIIHTRNTDKVNGHKPSVDVMFDSIAKFADNHTAAIILTGMGADGAKGLLKLRQKGAFTIGQDEASSIVYGMPMVAYKLGAVTRQVALEDVASTLLTFLSAIGQK